MIKKLFQIGLMGLFTAAGFVLLGVSVAVVNIAYGGKNYLSCEKQAEDSTETLE